MLSVRDGDYGAVKGVGSSRAPFVLSVALHLTAGLSLLYLVQSTVSPPTLLFRPPKPSLVYIPVMPVEIPVLKAIELPAPLPVKAEEPAPPRPLPSIAPVFESRRAEVLKPIELPVEPPPSPAPPKPAAPKPEVTVGSFATAATAPARTPEPIRRIEIADFDRVAEKKVVAQPQTTALGAFDRSAEGNATRQPSTEIVIADSGFNRNALVQSTAPEGRVVRDTGFGNSNSREKPRTSQPPAEVVPVNFASAATSQRGSQSGAAPPQPRVVPVEVLFKPIPVYTEEARKMRIEGDVILEVEFLSSGTLRVIRVVRGLGYGLDEAATKAAAQIRFKPAQASGKAVDSRNTVSIVFRLA